MMIVRFTFENSFGFEFEHELPAYYDHSPIRLVVDRVQAMKTLRGRRLLVLYDEMETRKAAELLNEAHCRAVAPARVWPPRLPLLAALDEEKED